MAEGEEGAERLGGTEQRREQRSPLRGHRGVVHQEEDETVRARWRLVVRRLRTILGVLVCVGRPFGEVVHQVRSRDRHQHEQCHDGRERQEARAPPGNVPPL
jgi:hypothetical protein